MGTSDSEHAPAIEEKEEDPYPLEGKYKDEYDRQQYVPRFNQTFEYI